MDFLTQTNAAQQSCNRQETKTPYCLYIQLPNKWANANQMSLHFHFMVFINSTHKTKPLKGCVTVSKNITSTIADPLREYNWFFYNTLYTHKKRQIVIAGASAERPSHKSQFFRMFESLQQKFSELLHFLFCQKEVSLRCWCLKTHMPGRSPAYRSKVQNQTEIEKGNRKRRI